MFVEQLDAIGPMLGLSGAVTALLLSPIATELPEIMNAIIWVRQGKTKLALANISGAMMIQATVPSGLGLLFTAWKFDTALAWSGVMTMAAIVYLLATIRAGPPHPGPPGLGRSVLRRSSRSGWCRSCPDVGQDGLVRIRPISPPLLVEELAELIAPSGRRRGYGSPSTELRRPARKTSPTR